MPAPKKLTAKEIIAPMPIKPAVALERLPPEQLPEHLRALQGTATEGEAAGEAAEGEVTGGEAWECEVCEAAAVAAEGGAEADSEAGEEEAEEQEAGEEAEQEEAEQERLEDASDSEAEEDGAGDLEFQFDETGARIRPEEEAAREAAEAAVSETRNAAMVPAAKRPRRNRQVEILEQATGQEHTSDGQLRSEQQRQREPGIFSASAYFWMYYAPGPLRDPRLVKPGDEARPGECHAVLDVAANVDADSVTASNSTYEYAGIDAQRPELLYTKTFTCACAVCRERSSISLDFRRCPFAAFTGRWQQQTVHSVQGIARVAAERRLDARVFATSMQAEHLYAVFGSFAERGGRPYWLLWCKRAPYQAPSLLTSLSHPPSSPPL